MRKYIITAISAMMVCSIMVSAQQRNTAAHPGNCDDPMVHSTIVSLNNVDESKGFSLKMMESFSMPYGNLIPFTVQLEQGKLYSINYAVGPEFKQFTFTIIDRDNKKPVNKKVKSSKTKEHYLNQSFIASYTGQYIIVVSQQGADKGEHCGALSLMQAAANE